MCFGHCPRTFSNALHCCTATFGVGSGGVGVCSTSFVYPGCVMLVRCLWVSGGGSMGVWAEDRGWQFAW